MSGEVYETWVQIIGIPEARAVFTRRRITFGDSMAAGLEFRDRGEDGVK